MPKVCPGLVPGRAPSPRALCLPRDHVAFEPGPRGCSLRLVDGAITRVRFRNRGGVFEPELRATNCDAPAAQGLDVKSMANRVLEHFKVSFTVAPWSEEAQLTIKGFHMVFDAQCALVRDQGNETRAALLGSSPWMLGMISVALLIMEIAVGEAPMGGEAKLMEYRVARAWDILDVFHSVRIALEEGRESQGVGGDVGGGSAGGGVDGEGDREFEGLGNRASPGGASAAEEEGPPLAGVANDGAGKAARAPPAAAAAEGCGEDADANFLMPGDPEAPSMDEGHGEDQRWRLRCAGSAWARAGGGFEPEWRGLAQLEKASMDSQGAWKGRGCASLIGFPQDGASAQMQEHGDVFLAGREIMNKTILRGEPTVFCSDVRGSIRKTLPSQEPAVRGKTVALRQHHWKAVMQAGLGQYHIGTRDDGSSAEGQPGAPRIHSKLPPPDRRDLHLPFRNSLMKLRGVSLQDIAITCPEFTDETTGVLWRFKRIAVGARLRGESACCPMIAPPGVRASSPELHRRASSVSSSSSQAPPGPEWRKRRSRRAIQRMHMRNRANRKLERRALRDSGIALSAIVDSRGYSMRPPRMPRSPTAGVSNTVCVTISAQGGPVWTKAAEELSEFGEIARLDVSLSITLGTVLVTYFDVRCAQMALLSMASFAAPFPQAEQDCRIVLVDVPSLCQKLGRTTGFQDFGEVAQVDIVAGQSVVEFYDCRSAQALLAAAGDCATPLPASAVLPSTRPPKDASGHLPAPQRGRACDVAGRREAQDFEKEWKFGVDPGAILRGEDKRTTVMVKNLYAAEKGKGLSRQGLLLLLDRCGLGGRYSFFYMPCNEKKGEHGLPGFE
ncbi:unnamed protein product [Prorocentrum cordatum]|uniref:Uncharacterized protein n=1 Tax=Prorocentrum cordatum TaxID=2364126 RepID=A0ABN9SGL9_9DINO|nr:unnamed protein product [Polarella glacialis]